MPKIVWTIFRVSEIVLELMKLRSIEMTIITGIIGIVLYIVILKVVYQIEDSVLMNQDIIKIELDEMDRDNIN